MRAEQVYGTVVVQNESLPLSNIDRQFVDKLFRVQLQKLLLRFLDQWVLNLVEEERRWKQQTRTKPKQHKEMTLR
ncbi:hypothetical protein H5410_061182 [Solanum commersonii]|uniref:Uncharacterized protein n=1 Tax=Solanum commersonii TaxID=4109 RepID=A0A9J5W8D4_SOLCO|nr:hypothetical protein H5410_061182 [Solanum commersonii]